MYLLDVHNAHEMGENLEKHGSSPQLPFNKKIYVIYIDYVVHTHHPPLNFCATPHEKSWLRD